MEQMDEYMRGFEMGRNWAVENEEKALQQQDSLLRSKADREADSGPQDEDYWVREGCLAGIDSVLNATS